MTKRLYVGNLPFSTTETQVRELFEAHGTVHSINLIEDRMTGRSRGFGFVEMDGDAAEAAISALSGKVLGDREMKVNEAKPQRNGGGGRGL